MSPARRRSAVELPGLRFGSRARALALAAALALWGMTSSATADLILWYTFNDDTNTTFAADSGIPPAADGQFILNATRTNQTPDAAGFSLNLDVPGNSYVKVGDPAKLNNLTNLTITFWINLRRWLAVSTDRVIDKTISTSPGTGGFGIRSTSSTSNLTFGIDFTTAAGPISPPFRATNQWYFVAVTYDGTRSNLNIQWFMGGLTNPAVGAGPASQSGWAGGPLPNSAANFRIGGTDAATARRSPYAWIDDVRVYNEVLSPVQIESIRRAVSNLPLEPGVLSFTANGAGGVPLPQSTYVTGGSNIVLAAAVSGAAPMGVDLFRNGAPLPGASGFFGATAVELTTLLPGGVPEHAGNYQVVVTNSYGAATSTIPSLEITTIFDSTVMSTLWTVPPGIRDYLSSSDNQTRSMAFNPASVAYPDRGSLVLARWGGPTVKFVQLLDPATGDTGPTLATTDGGSVTMTIGNRGINAVGAAEDGAIYVGNLVITATNPPFYLYRYASDDYTTVLPTIVFSGDPGGPNYPGLRWGDSMAVRGAGAGTEILLGPAGGPNFGPLGGSGNRIWETNIVALLRTADGTTFTSIPIWITNAPTDFATLGVAFGPGTNTFFAKNALNRLFFVEYDMNAGIGRVKHASSLEAVPCCVTAIGTDFARQYLGALSLETPDNLRLYGITDPLRDPPLLDQGAFEADNSNGLNGGMGAVAFGTNVVYVLNVNNGVKAFQINTNYTQPGPFSITSIQPAPAPGVAAISWPAANGRTYQVQSRASVETGGWARIGAPVLGTGASATITNLQLTGSVTNRFYRVVAQ